MTIRRFAPFAAALLTAALLAALPAPARAEAPDPAKVVTTADLQKVFGGKWTASSPEPGVLICEEPDGVRVVHVYLFPANGKSVAEMAPGHRENGETVDDVAGVGDAAMYRPQYGEATAEKLDAKTGERLWLSLSVHNVDGPDARKRLAVALLRLAAAKL
jgi:hypothetical protein